MDYTQLRQFARACLRDGRPEALHLATRALDRMEMRQAIARAEILDEAWPTGIGRITAQQVSARAARGRAVV